MSTETFSAFFLSVCLACFFSVNVHNILILKRKRNHLKVYAEVERPSGFAMIIAAIGTLAYFVEAIIYVFLVFNGLLFSLHIFPLYFQFPLTSYIQVVGLFLNGIGYSLFIWSVTVRGKYAVSWNMPDNQRLVTSGPYKYVRHPSYLGYFLMFLGLFLLWSNIVTLFPIFAIPGYIQVSAREEKLLVQRFGSEYTDYQKRTGRFIPKF